MPYDRFLIAPSNTGLQSDLPPWLIAEDAFFKINNAYVWRGRIRKRFGSRLMGSNPSDQTLSRLKLQVATIMSGGASGTVPLNAGAVGQMFSIGSELFTVSVLGTPATLLDTSNAATKTFNTSTGAFVFSGVSALDGTPVYWYPALPVMGFGIYEIGSINNEPAYAFDTSFAYVFNGSTWSLASNSPIFKGDNLNFFWVTNWTGSTDNVVLMFISNFNADTGTSVTTNDDPMYYFDGTNWTVFTPAYLATNTPWPSPTNSVVTARIILPFKGRLVLLNTIEANDTGIKNAFVNRCRYSQNGSPTAANAYLEPNQTGYLGGGFVDAATDEQIVSAEFIKDRLIVYFERSTWELAYTGNEILPFVWQKLNAELGSEATFSTVPFDKEVYSIGNVGVHSCNGSNVQRIDNKIPEYIFRINNRNSSAQRTFGIRDYYVEMVYWAFVDNSSVPSSYPYPNKVLVYNYENNSWAFNDDVITAFGYCEQQTDLTWEEATFTWESANFTWDSQIEQAQSRQVIAGNHQGYTFFVRPDVSQNAPSLQITNAVFTTASIMTLTIIQHMLFDEDYISIQNALFYDSGTMQYSVLTGIFQVSAVLSNVNQVTIVLPINDPSFVVPSGSYVGGGTAARVSVIDIWSKQWNPYVSQGRNVYIHKIDFAVERTANGQVTIDYFPSAATGYSMLKSANSTGTTMGTVPASNALPSSVTITPYSGTLETSPYDLYPLEQEQDRLWHPVYLQADGECIQIRIYLNDLQLRNPAVAFEDLVIEGIMLYTAPTTSRLQ